MASLDTLDGTVEENFDPRTKDWPLISSPVPLIIISICYLYFVLKCGPRFMEKREAYSLTSFTKYYNVFQIIVNGAFIYRVYYIGWFDKYGFLCDYTPAYQTDRLSMQIAAVTWWLLLLKITDYIETIVFVLRKKQRQISLLHLYHHVSTALLSWTIVRYFAAGDAIFVLIINCGVHVIMYTYYYLSTLGPNVQQMIAPFKRIVTIIQMVQFVILLIHSVQGYLPHCNFSKRVAFMFQVNIALNFYLFYKFYKKTYMKPKRK